MTQTTLPVQDRRGKETNGSYTREERPGHGIENALLLTHKNTPHTHTHTHTHSLSIV